MTWKITHDSAKHHFKNETSRRINRNLWNHLTIDAKLQTDFKFVKRTSKSDMIWTRYLWDYWIRSIPIRLQSEQINELVSSIMNFEMGPKNAVKQLNRVFFILNTYSLLSRVFLITLLISGKFIIKYCYT